MGKSNEIFSRIDDLLAAYRFLTSLSSAESPAAGPDIIVNSMAGLEEGLIL
jgi:hypothetical protein